MATAAPPKTMLQLLKDDIRSVLIPFKDGCSYKQFTKEYKELVAPQLPNPRDFGFDTFVNLLCSLQDTIYVTERNGDHHLNAVATKETQHIKKLVSKQKNSNSSKSKRFSSYSIGASFKTYPSQYSNSSFNKYGQRKNMANFPPRPTPGVYHGSPYSQSPQSIQPFLSRNNITHAQSMPSSIPVQLSAKSSRPNTFISQQFSSRSNKEDPIYYRQTNLTSQNNSSHSPGVYSQPKRSEPFSQPNKNAFPSSQFAATNKNVASQSSYSHVNHQPPEPKYHIGDENYNTSKQSNTYVSPQTLPLKSNDPATNEMPRNRPRLDVQAVSRLTSMSLKPSVLSETNHRISSPSNVLSNPPITSLPTSFRGDSRSFISPNPRNKDSYTHSLPPGGIASETAKSAASSNLRNEVSYTHSLPPGGIASETAKSAASSNGNATSSMQPHYSPIINGIIQKFIGCFKNGLDVDELPSQFAKVHNYALAYEKYNYSSLRDFLSNIPGIFMRNVNNKTIVFYTGDEEKAQNPAPSNTSVHDNSNPKHSTIADWVTEQNNIDHDVNLNESFNYEPLEPRTNSRLSNRSCEPSHTGGVSECAREIVKSIMKQFPNGIRATQFPSQFKEKSGEPLDLHRFGFPNLTEFLNTMPDILKYQPVQGNRRDFLILPLTALQRDVESHQINDLIKSVATALETILLAAGKEGIPLDELQSVYQYNIKKPLPIEEMGFDNLENFLCVFLTVMPLTIEAGKDGVKTVILAQKKEVAIHQEEHVEELRPRQSEKESIQFDVVHPNSQYLVRKLSEGILSGSEYFPVYLSSAQNPHHIFIQVNDDQITEMEKIYENMQYFYTNIAGELYKMKPVHIKKNAVCAAFYPDENRWYRAMITKVAANAKEVCVNYMDYATLHKISVQDLRYLKKEFFDLPMQAIFAKIAYLKPKDGDRWPDTIQKAILNFVKNKQLSAKVAYVDDAGDPHLILCDMNDDTEPYLNDFLIEQKYAVESIDPVGQPEIPVSSISAELNANIERVITLCKQTNEDTCRQAPHLKDIFIDIDAYMNALEKHLITMKQCFNLDPNSEEQRARTAEKEQYLRKVFEQFHIPPPIFPERYVKRVDFTSEWVFHIIKVNECPFVSAGDVSKLLWKNKDDVDYVVNQLEHIGTKVPSLSLCESSNNAELFLQIKRFQVYGHRVFEGKSYILLYPLKNLMYILNLFGHPSEYLRQDVLEESKKFDPQQTFWKVITPYNLPAVGEARPDTKEIEKSKLLSIFCLTQLNEMQKSFALKRKQVSMSTDANKAKELQKLNKYADKITHEVIKITDICKLFDAPLHMDLYS